MGFSPKSGASNPASLADLGGHIFVDISDVSVVSQVPPLQIKKIMADLCRVYCRSVVKSKKAMRSPLCPLDGYKVGSVSLVCCCPFFDRGRCDWFWYLMDKVGGFTKHRWICCFPNVHFCLWRITLFLSLFLWGWWLMNLNQCISGELLGVSNGTFWIYLCSSCWTYRNLEI